MAIVKPKNLKVNFEAAWKELKKHLGLMDVRSLYSTILLYMNGLEKKHENMIDIKERSNPEIVDYCIKKSTEAQMENIHLRKMLRGRKVDNEKVNKLISNIIDKIYEDKIQYDLLTPRKHINLSPCDIYTIESLEEIRLMLPRFQKMVGKKKKPKRKLFNVNLITVTDDSLELNLNMKVTAKKFEYYKKAFDEREDISWHELKMRIVELNYSYPENDIREGMTFRYIKRGEGDEKNNDINNS